MSKDFILSTSRSNKIRITAFGEEDFEKKPCLIFIHGFKGFKDWGFGPYIGKYFADKGFFSVTFNFSHNGVGESLTEFVELDKFAENTFSLEISELNELIDSLKEGYLGKAIKNKIGLVGHSRGGGISLLTASTRNDINAVSIWSSVANFDRYTERQKDIWRKRGYVDIMNTRTKKKMRLNVDLLEDIEKNNDSSLNIENAVNKLNKPLLIIHGEQDLAVKSSEAEKIYNWSDKSKTELITIPSTGHTYDVKHPFEGSNPKFDSVLNNTLRFFRKHMN